MNLPCFSVHLVAGDIFMIHVGCMIVEVNFYDVKLY
jgi:hypothetical protein